MDVEDAVVEATGSEDGSAASAAPPSRRRRRSQRNISKASSNSSGGDGPSGGMVENSPPIADPPKRNIKSSPPPPQTQPEPIDGGGVVDDGCDDEDEGCEDDDDEDEETYSETDGALDFNDYYSFNEDLDDVGGMGSSAGEGTSASTSGCGGGVSGNSMMYNNNDDPEFFVYECLEVEKAEKALQDQVQVVSNVTKLGHSEAKLLLHINRWSTAEAIKNASSFMSATPTSSSPSTQCTQQLSSPPASSSTVASHQNPSSPPHQQSASSSSTSALTSKQPSRPQVLHPLQVSETFLFCDVCAVTQASADFSCLLPCKHLFCKGCWEHHFEHQIQQGLSTSLGCMSTNCDSRAHEDFVLAHVTKESVRDRFKQLAFFDYIRSHPQLRFCPGNNCKYVIKAEKCVHKRATCTSCKTSFCYQCGSDYHAPTDCETIKRWLTKCADDSETANYISAHTRDCPKCNICIEKNGGCNHMRCYHCKHDFCWMCLGDWKTHGSEYYECSRYKENPNIAHESAHAQAREALKKYLHYFERWENHSNSMKLEAQTLAKIKGRINEKVMKSCGTWIDWQYLLDAAALLAKCRYTLQYTYPYAYYMEPSNRKKLFECQQAQLEAEIENLSWKIEHAEITDRGDLENQMNVAEKRRTSLLKDFLKDDVNAKS